MCLAYNSKAILKRRKITNFSRKPTAGQPFDSQVKEPITILAFFRYHGDSAPVECRVTISTFQPPRVKRWVAQVLAGTHLLMVDTSAERTSS